MSEYFQTLKELRARMGKETPELRSQPSSAGIMQKPVRKAQLSVRPNAPSSYIKTIEEFMKTLEEISPKEENFAPTPKGGVLAPVKTPEKESLGVEQSKEIPIKRGSTTDLSSVKFEYKGVPEDVAQDKAFMEAVGRLAAKLETAPENILAIIDFETGGTFDTAIQNAAGSGATGLIQFMPKTAEGLGTTVEALSQMNRAEQMKYVDKYFSQYASKLKGATAEELYSAVLYPASLGKAPETVLFKRGTKAYQQNAGLDIDNDGVITKGEASKRALMNRRA